MRRIYLALGLSILLLSLLGLTTQPASSDGLPKVRPVVQLTPPGGPGPTPTPTFTPPPPPPPNTPLPPPTSSPLTTVPRPSPTPRRTIAPQRTPAVRGTPSVTPAAPPTAVPTISPAEDGVLDDRDEFVEIPVTAPQQQELFQLLTDNSTPATVTKQDDLSIIEADPDTTPETAADLGTGALVRFVYVGEQAEAIDVYLGASEVPVARRIETLTGTPGYLRIESGLIHIVVTTSDSSKRVLLDEYGLFQAQNAYTLLITDPAATTITGSIFTARLADRPSQVFVLREDLRPTSGQIRIGVSIGPISARNTTFASRDLRRASSVRFQPGQRAEVGSGDVKPISVTLITTDSPTPGVVTNVQNVPTRPDRVYNVVIVNAPGSDVTAAIVLVSDPIRDYPPPKARR